MTDLSNWLDKHITQDIYMNRVLARLIELPQTEDGAFIVRDSKSKIYKDIRNLHYNKRQKRTEFPYTVVKADKGYLVHIKNI